MYKKKKKYTISKGPLEEDQSLIWNSSAYVQAEIQAGIY